MVILASFLPAEMVPPLGQTKSWNFFEDLEPAFMQKGRVVILSPVAGPHLRQGALAPPGMQDGQRPAFRQTGHWRSLEAALFQEPHAEQSKTLAWSRQTLHQTPLGCFAFSLAWATCWAFERVPSTGFPQWEHLGMHAWQTFPARRTRPPTWARPTRWFLQEGFLHLAQKFVAVLWQPGSAQTLAAGEP